MEYTGYVVIITMICLGLYKKNSKFITFCLVVYSILLFGLNVGSADDNVYKYIYDTCFDLSILSHEPGYMLLCRICHFMGIPYQMFKLIVAVPTVLLTYKCISLYTKDINFAFVLYLIFPFAGAISGIRNTLANAIVLYALHFLLEKNAKSLLKYVLSLIIATCFHYTALFFFLAPFVLSAKINPFQLLFGVTALIPCVVLLAKTGLFFTIASRLTSSEKVLNWFTFSPFFSKIYFFSFGLAVALLLMLLYVRKFLPKNSAGYLCTKSNLVIIFKIGTLTLLSFSGAIFRSVVFLRLLTTLMPVYYAMFTQALSANREDSVKIAKEKLALQIALLFCALFLLWFVYGFWIGGDAIQNFQKNLLFT